MPPQGKRRVPRSTVPLKGALRHVALMHRMALGDVPKGSPGLPKNTDIRPVHKAVLGQLMVALNLIGHTQR